ncbi:MAG TPA: 3-oxoacyl-ACP reductase FabG [Gemmataceae bacterium]|nr:3-oxoacyl-ACP reductase FabG [Gemmataceae bacterium]
MNERIFEGRVAVVTGGSRGIGRAICQMLADAGARVAINYERNESAARDTLGMIGGHGFLVQANVANEAQVSAMMARIRQQLGPIDFLVNNAGIYGQLPHDQMKFAEWKRMLEVNVDGVFLTTWAVKDEMIARRFGRIVNISSIAGLVMKKNMIHYATSKAAVIAFTRSCSEAFAPYNVRVNCVAPGLTDTEMARSADPKLLEQLVAATPLGRMGQPGEIAAVVRFLLSEDSSFMTGQTLVACGGRV